MNVLSVALNKRLQGADSFTVMVRWAHPNKFYPESQIRPDEFRLMAVGDDGFVGLRLDQPGIRLVPWSAVAELRIVEEGE